jgi:hypothetical protein
MPVQEFILALAQHISPKGFQMTKHLGLYANRSRRKYASVISMFQRKGRLLQKRLFTSNPRCEECGSLMHILEILPPTDPPKHLIISNYVGQQWLRASA